MVTARRVCEGASAVHRQVSVLLWAAALALATWGSGPGSLAVGRGAAGEAWAADSTGRDSVAAATPAPTPAPAATGPSIDRYLRVRGVAGGSLSPDGNRVAFLTNITGTNQVWVVSTKGGWPTQVTFFDDRVQNVSWSPSADLLAFSKDVGGNERGQIYLVKPDGSGLVRLTQGDEVIHNFGGWSEDGKSIAYSDNSRDPKFFDVYVLDVATRQAKRVLQSDHLNQPAGFSPSGRYLLVRRNLSNTSNDLLVVDLSTGESRLLTAHKDEARYVAANWKRNESGLYLLSDQGRPFLNLAELPLDKPKLRYLEERQWDVEDLTLSRDGRYLITVTNVDGYGEIDIRDLNTRSREAAPPLPRGLPQIADLSSDGKLILVRFSGPRDPSDLWAYRTDTASLEPVTRSSTAGLDASTFVEPELVRYKGYKGLDVPAFLYRPKGATAGEALPVIIDVHGGPEAQARPTFSGVRQYFLDQGYAVLTPNVRGSTGYGKDYRDLDDGKNRLDAVADLAEAARWLARAGVADPRRIAVMGGSYGGYMTLAALAFHPDLWAAGVDIVGIASFKTFFANTAAWRREVRASEYGDPVKDAALLETISPLNSADRIRAPLIVVQGANDPRVPKVEADQIVDSIKKRGGAVEYLLYPDEGHGLVKLSNRLDAYPKIAEFLRRYLARGAAASAQGASSGR